MSNASSDPPRSHQKWDLPWGIPAALLVGAFGFFAIQMIVSMLVGVLVVLLGLPESALESNAFTAAFYLLIATVNFALLIWFVRWQRAVPADLGFGEKPRLSMVGWAVLGLIAYILLTVLMSGLVSILFPEIDLAQEQVTGFGGTEASFDYLLIFLSLVIIPPLTEEIVFRGIVFGGLRKSLPFWLAAFVSSALFAIAHFQLNVALDTFSLAIVSCYLYERTRSLWPSIALHAIKNGIAFAVLFVGVV